MKTSSGREVVLAARPNGKPKLTPKVLAAIKRQTYASLFANDRGVMIGDGEVWFSAVCRDAACKDAPIRIIAINP